MLAPPNLVRSRTWWAAITLVLVVGSVVAIRVRLLELPLERDEGEYAYAGQLMLQGVPPYRELYSMKWPGTFAIYATSMWLFGQSVAGIHLGLVLTNLLTVLIVFLIGRRIYGTLAASVAAGTYALLSISPSTLGLAAHTTHFVLLPALLGVLLLQRLNEQSRVWRVGLAGVLFGLGTLMKQSGAILALFAALWLLWLENSSPKRDVHRLLGRLVALGAGAALPLGITAALLAKAGVLGRFWLWTVEYSQAYAGLLTPFEGVKFLAQSAARLFQAAPGLWSLALLGLILLWFNPTSRPWKLFLSVFALFSFLSVCPGWYFREHYFLLLLPAVGLLAGAAIVPLESQGTRNSRDDKSPVDRWAVCADRLPAFLPLLRGREAMLQHYCNIFAQLIVTPFEEVSLVWGIVPLYFALLLNELTSDKANFRTAIQTGFSFLWAAAQWLYAYWKAHGSGVRPEWTWSLPINLFVTFLVLALGIIALFSGLRRRYPKYGSVLGHTRFANYFMIMIFPIQSHRLTWSWDRLIVIVLFAVPIWLLLHFGLMPLRGRKV